MKTKLKYPDVSEVLRGEALAKEDDTWIRLIHEKQHLAEMLTGLDFGSILEIGCGTGIYAGMLSKKFPNATYVGVDANPEALDIAKRRNPDLIFSERDFRTFQTLASEFDLVCAHAFLKHFDYENWLTLFPKFLSLGRVAQFDMQTTAFPTFNDGSPSFGNNLWVNEFIFYDTLSDAGHKVISSEIAYEKGDRRATIFLTERK